MIKKQLKILLLVTALVIISTIALYFLQNDEKPSPVIETKLIINREFFDVVMINVTNDKDTITVIQENGGFRMEGVSSEIINPDYLQQIVADSAYIEYDQKIENPQNVSGFGLDSPTSEVEITYKDGKQLKLLIGDEGPINNTRYVQNVNDGKVYLLKKAATIRFTMSKEDFVHYIIVPPHQVQDVLSTINYVKYDGKLLDRPIIIEKVDTNNEQQLMQSSSFGVASHLMIEPTLQKIDLREANLQFSALVGLLNHGIVGFDLSDSELEKYGFDDPDLVMEFSFSPDAKVEATTYLLEVTTINNQSYAMVNRNKVIHIIEEEAFLSIAYEKIISRWFFTPLLLDVEELIFRSNNLEHVFSIEKLGNNEIKVLKDNNEIDSDAFRKFYNLVVSASHDGTYQSFSTPNESILEIEFNYIDQDKSNDVVKYYQGGARRNNVCFNETCGFAIKDTYVETINNAISLIEKDEFFPSNWE